jgi:hypothetical protein
LQPSKKQLWPQGGSQKTTTQVVASALRDPLLYTVVDDTSGEFEAAGPVRVVRGSFHFPDPSGNGEPPPSLGSCGRRVQLD